MLRVLRFEEPYSVHVRLEGTLTADSAAGAQQEWLQIQAAAQGRKLLLDASGLTAIDGAGRALLAELLRAGTRIDDGGHHLLPAAAAKSACADRLRRTLCLVVCSAIPIPHLCPCGPRPDTPK